MNGAIQAGSNYNHRHGAGGCALKALVGAILGDVIEEGRAEVRDSTWSSSWFAFEGVAMTGEAVLWLLRRCSEFGV